MIVFRKILAINCGTFVERRYPNFSWGDLSWGANIQHSRERFIIFISKSIEYTITLLLRHKIGMKFLVGFWPDIIDTLLGIDNNQSPCYWSLCPFDFVSIGAASISSHYQEIERIIWLKNHWFYFWATGVGFRDEDSYKLMGGWYSLAGDCCQTYMKNIILNVLSLVGPLNYMISTSCQW